MIKDYDLIIVRKHSETDFGVWEIYPNEDNGKRTPVQKYFDDGWDCRTIDIDNFINKYEGRACIEENYNSVEEILSSFNFEAGINWCSNLSQFHTVCHFMKENEVAIFWRI